MDYIDYNHVDQTSVVENTENSLVFITLYFSDKIRLSIGCDILRCMFLFHAVRSILIIPYVQLTVSTDMLLTCPFREL